MEYEPFNDSLLSLEESKQEFRRAMLANDTFFALVRKKLAENEELSHPNINSVVEHDNFLCEPVVRRTEAGNHASVKIDVFSDNNPTEELKRAGRSFYFHIAAIEDSESVLDPVFIEQVKEVNNNGTDNEKQLAASVLATWKAAYMGIIRGNNEDLTTHPDSGCFVLKSDMEDQV